MNKELFKKLSKLQWLMHKRHMLKHANGGPMADTSRGQGRILAILKMQDGISTKDLSYLLGIRVSSLNELLSKLEKNGYITRETSDNDKRVFIIRLTEKGREEKEQSTESKSIFSCLSEEELKNFIEYIDRIINELKNELGITSEDFDDFHGHKAEMIERLHNFHSHANHMHHHRCRNFDFEK